MDERKVERTLKDLYLAIRYHNAFENPNVTHVQWDKYEIEALDAIREIDPTFAQEKGA